MAKYQAINIFEAHIEKIIVFLVFVLLVNVFCTLFNPPTSIEINGKRFTATEAVCAAAQKADQIAADLNRPGPLDETLTPYEPQAHKFLDSSEVIAFETYLSPPYSDPFTVFEERRYRVPEVLALKDIKVAVTQSVVPIPTSLSSRTDGTPIDERDIDFVTVSATYPMQKFINQFRDHFGPSVKKPLEIAEPVIAAVELQRREFLPDGQWSDYETVPRMEVSPIDSTLNLSAEEAASWSLTQYKETMKARRDARLQLEVLQPWPYDLAGRDWISPVDANGQIASDNRRHRTPRRFGPSQSMAVPDYYSAEGIDDIMTMEMEMMMGGVGPETYSSYPRRQSQRDPRDLDVEELYIWAHDDQVMPGGIYSYRLRIGFFNPVYRKPWTIEDQKHLQNEPILWTEPIVTKQVINIPHRTYFFPKFASGTKDDSSVRMEVYRRQHGQWFSRTFRVTPGGEIGELVKVKAPLKSEPSRSSTDTKNNFITVDFRTGATIVDIVPQCKTWQITDTTTQALVCEEIVYQDAKGIIKRIGVDKKTWPNNLSDMYSIIRKEYKEQQENRNQYSYRNTERQQAMR